MSAPLAQHTLASAQAAALRHRLRRRRPPAIEQNVARLAQPGRHVEGEQPPLGAALGDRRLEPRIPPAVTDVGRNAEPAPRHIASARSGVQTDSTNSLRGHLPKQQQRTEAVPI
ncbi:hypothetical protein [Burkholderia gladioli]|uniref:hypothetical protein n=1 Tax=Burkholderia gladioli TaxID=28095 RepID=UPI001641CAB2|nr:hypothetical protein [Burkholderia gladioli]MDN7741655.1 hypothetical protein [Burkholderia gladioli]